MSFKKADGKIIYLSLIGVIATILTITFCILTMRDPDKFGAAFITIISVVIGYFFKNENNVSRETIERNKKEGE